MGQNKVCRHCALLLSSNEAVPLKWTPIKFQKQKENTCWFNKELLYTFLWLLLVTRNIKGESVSQPTSLFARDGYLPSEASASTPPSVGLHNRKTSDSATQVKLSNCERKVGLYTLPPWYTWADSRHSNSDLNWNETEVLHTWRSL